MLGALSACHLEHTRTCPAISTVTRVVIIGEGGSTLRTFTDARQISPLVAYANARRESSKPWYDMPASNIGAVFYDNSIYLCSIGAGSNFLVIACPNWSGIRSASGSELSEFKNLIGESR